MHSGMIKANKINKKSGKLNSIALNHFIYLPAHLLIIANLAFCMAEKYYFDTSIWLDFFENRSEPNLPKGAWAHKLLNKITEEDNKIIYSDMVILEFGASGYQPHEIEKLFEKIKPILVFVESTEKQAGKAKDLSLKRSIPKGDALHAILARDNKAVLVTLDNHFKKLLDIAKPNRPQDII